MALSGTPSNSDDYDALAEARRAARRAGMTLAEWLDVVVEGRTQSAPDPAPQRKSTHGSTEETIAAIRARLDEFARRHTRPDYAEPDRRTSRDIMRRLEDRLDALSRSSRGGASESHALHGSHDRDPLLAADQPSPYVEPASRQDPKLAAASEPASGLKDAIAEIAARQRALEQEFGQAMAGYSDRLDHRIDRAAERLERRIDNASPTAAMRDLEEELRGVSARIERQREAPVPGLRDELTGLARRLEDLPPRVAEEMAGRLEDTARRIDTATRAEVDSIRAEMREIAREIDRATRSGFEEVRAEIAELTARMSQAQAPEPPIEVGLGEEGRAELASLRDDIRTLTNRIEASFSRSAERPGSGGLGEEGRAELAALRADIRALASQVEGSHRDGQDSLRQELRELAERIDARNPDRLRELERHLDILVERIGREPAGIDGGELAEIERQISKLGDRFEATPDWLMDVQHRLDRVAERMGDSSSAPGGHELAEIERQIARLADRLDAEGAAGADLVGIERKIGELFLYLDSQQGSDRAVVGLKDDFATLKAGFDDANERNMAALNAMHETLGRIVDRISDLEEEIESAVGGARQPAATPHRDYEADEAGTGRERPEVATDDIIGRIEAVTRSFKSDIEDHTPLAPGSGPPRAASTTEEEADAPKASRDDFIAAARRAAQAATAEAGVQEDLPAGATRSGAVVDRLKAYRRPLLIAAAIGLLIVGALQLADIMSSRNAGSAVQPTPLEDTTGAPDGATDSGPAGDAAPVEPAAEPATEGSLPTPPRAIGLGQPNGSQITTGTTAVPEDIEVPAIHVPSVAELAVAADGPPAREQAQARTDLTEELPPEIGSERLRNAAAQGDPAAQFEVALRFTDGRGVPQDLARAARWYRLAAGQGLAPAQYRLGSLYEKGHGVPRDISMARTWYQRAAEQGNRTAMHNLAVLFAEGVDGEPDYEQAALWFRQSSEYGLKDSQYNLAILHARGLGVEASLSDSYRWFAAAAEQGDVEAAVQRDEIARRLEPEARAAAELAAQSWQPRPMIEEANRVAQPDGGWDGDVAEQPREPGSMVREAQALLDRLGYQPGPIDGQAGAMTRRAVIDFQRAAGLPETGEITPSLLDHLNREAG